MLDHLHSSWRCYQGKQPTPTLRYPPGHAHNCPFWPIVQNSEPSHALKGCLEILCVSFTPVEKSLHSIIYESAFLGLRVYEC